MFITKEEKSIKKILYFIECTVILHNFLIVESETEMPPEWLSEVDLSQSDNSNELNCSVPHDLPQNTRKMQLMTYKNELLFEINKIKD